MHENTRFPAAKGWWVIVALWTVSKIPITGVIYTRVFTPIFTGIPEITNIAVICAESSIIKTHTKITVVVARYITFRKIIVFINTPTRTVVETIQALSILTRRATLAVAIWSKVSNITAKQTVAA